MQKENIDRKLRELPLQSLQQHLPGESGPWDIQIVARWRQVKRNITELVEAAEQSGKQLGIKSKGAILVELACYCPVVNTLLEHIPKTLVHEAIPYEAPEPP